MDLINPPHPADPLGEALHSLRMGGAFYCRSELTEPWGLTLMPLPGYVWFHVVASGRATVEDPEGETAELGKGDVAVVAHGGGHVIRSGPGAPAPGILELDREQVSDRYEVLRWGGEGERTDLLCGAVRFSSPASANLIAVMPRLIRIAGGDAEGAGWMQATLALIAEEARHPRPGGEAVITRLADVLVIQAIRSWIESDPAAQTGWLGALRDPQIGRALALIHRDPARSWTLESLASELAMSRSAFAARFSELVGEPAVQYLTRLRMQLAENALLEPGATVGEVAHELGYGSEAAFARAFKRVVGIPPGAVRRSRAEDPLELALAEATAEA